MSTDTKSKYYVTTMPLGSGIAVQKQTSFLGRTIDMPDEVAKALIKMHEDYWTVQGWLEFLYEGASRRDFKMDLPDKIEEILCLAEKAKPEPKPKPKATARGSKKKSPVKRKKTPSKRSTSQKTES